MTGIVNLGFKQGLLFEKSKEADKFRATKSLRSARTASKTRRGNKF